MIRQGCSVMIPEGFQGVFTHDCRVSRTAVRLIGFVLSKPILSQRFGATSRQPIINKPIHMQITYKQIQTSIAHRIQNPLRITSEHTPLLSFDSIFIKDAQCAESNEKSIFRFFRLGRCKTIL